MKTINYYKLGGFIILGLLVIALVGMLWLNSFKIFDDPQVIEAFSQCDRENNFKFSEELYTGNAVTNRSIHLSVSKCDGQARETEVFIADSPNASLTDITTSWKDENELLVAYNEELRIFRKEEKVRISGKVLKISYEPFRVLSKSELASNKEDLGEIISDIEREYINRFNDDYPANLEPLEIYSKLEDYYILTGALKSKSKSDYQKFYKDWILSDSAFEISCSFKLIPQSGNLFSPSNMIAHLEIYSMFSKDSTNLGTYQVPITRINTVLSQMRDNMEFNYRRPRLVDQYFSSITSSQFSENLVFRMPLIAIAFRDQWIKQYERKDKEKEDSEID